MHRGRRRKIRCKFQAGNTSQCLPCKVRGSLCVDQRDVLVNRENHDDLRERISRIESALLPLQNQPASTLQEPNLNFQDLKIILQQDRTGDLDEAREADKRAPFVSMLNDAEVFLLVLDTTIDKLRVFTSVVGEIVKCCR
jgi:hypothetical protein